MQQANREEKEQIKGGECIAARQKGHTRIVLIRHCEAEGNKNRVFQGHTDAQVSENGKKQLELLALRCRNMPFEALYSSPLRRAMETAQAVNRYHNLPMQICEGLIEINGGVWEGKPWDSFASLYPELTDQWYHEPWLFAPDQGEPMRHVYDRMRRAVCEIVKANQGKLICAVSHGCAIRNFLCWASGRPVERLNEVDWCDNTALSVVDFDESLRPAIVLGNDASHLNQEVSTFAKQDWWKPENRVRH
ncbi:MAG TPA: histidine phosphatase family protein [Candidatus Gallacutalibacter stercoravium]|nr:histidine phosphatase family protein [Candidatus Gallacutalibacter stercoravium]